MSLLHETVKDDKLTQVYFVCVETKNDLLLAHWHHHLEIIYMVKGCMTAHINESAYELQPGDILIVNPRDIHSMHICEESCYYLLQISSSHLERIDPEWKLIHFEEYIPYSSNKKSLNSILAAILKKFSRLDIQKEKGYQLLFLAELYKFLYILYTEGASFVSIQNKNRTERDFSRIEQSMQFVKKNYRRQITLTEAAGQISVTTEYFCRLFKKYTGQTFFNYVAQIRLLHFYQELLQTDESITYLLERNGITNYKKFMRMFKEAYGTTPHKLRIQKSGIKEKYGENVDIPSF